VAWKARILERMKTLGGWVLVAWMACGLVARAAEPTVVAFGSCHQQGRDGAPWDAIIAAKPEVFVFLGDNIYGDTDDMGVLREKYGRLGGAAGFQRLRSACPVMATWDDHDYGKNDSGGEWPKKEESRREFLTFWGEPAGSARWKRAGVYDARTFGVEGRRVQVVLLDTRYHRSPLKREGRDWVPDAEPGCTFLGEEQWAWLEGVLREPAEVRVIASSIQVVSEEHGFEKWANFPRERERLLRLLAAASGRVVVVSGDRHFAEVSRVRAGSGDAGRWIYDVTSSALNQRALTHAEANRHRVGGMVTESNFGVLTVEWAGGGPQLTAEIRVGNGTAASQAVLEP
jgi:alkaline phosphatase D